jgi:hypothetical protein
MFLVAMLQVVFHGAAERSRHHQLVFDQDVVELGALQVSGHIDIEIAGEVTPAVTPIAVPFVGDEVQEPPQVELVGHVVLSLSTLEARQLGTRYCTVSGWYRRHCAR